MATIPNTRHTSPNTGNVAIGGHHARRRRVIKDRKRETNLNYAISCIEEALTGDNPATVRYKLTEAFRTVREDLRDND